VAQAKGYRVVLVVPDKMSSEKVLHLKALGAEVHITRSDVGKGHPVYYQDMARRLAADVPGAFFADQFNNPANPLAHETATAPEIWAQMGHEVDAIVVGVGSAGTITGLTRFFRKVQPSLRFVLADPQGSVLAEYVKSGVVGKAGSWAVEGIGEDFVPGIADLSRYGCLFDFRRGELCDSPRTPEARRHSCGLVNRDAACAALRYCRAQTQAKRVVSLSVTREPVT
jgi:cystathionine beta-synthase